MAKQAKKSGLANKITESLKVHAKDDTVVRTDFSAPPPGIIGGIANLNYAKIGVYISGVNEGEKFVRLAGSIISPKIVTISRQTWKDGKVVNLPVQQETARGSVTSRMFPLCDTTTADGTVTSADEHIAEMLNELRTLGGDHCTEEINSEESLAAVLETLETADIFFKLSTSASKPTKEYPLPRTWENWRGRCDYTLPEDGQEVVDNIQQEEVKPPFNPEKDDREATLAALGEAADGGDKEAGAQLFDQAAKLGIDAGKIDTWTEVASEILAKEQEGDSKPEKPDEPGIPEVGDNYLYKAPKAKKATEFEVTAVFEAKKTVNLKALDDEKNIVKGVPWKELDVAS